MPSIGRLAISSMSLGRAWHHRLAPKLRAAAAHGFEGIELFFEDLEYHARELFPYPDDERTEQRFQIQVPKQPRTQILLPPQSLRQPRPDHLLLAAADVRKLCDQFNLEIISLQPFMHYEGLLDRSQKAAALDRAKLWFEIAKVLRTDIVALPSSFLDASQITGNQEIIVQDLQDLADLAASYDIRIVYEALCWGTYVDTWEESWAMVQAVDRPNFGICLDTFNIAGRIYADPTTTSGTVESSLKGSTAFAEQALHSSLRNLLTTMDPSKIFFVQLVDAEKLQLPILPGHEFFSPDQPARMSWSRNCRLFYGEEDRGAYLPVRQIIECIVNELGYRGWISMELFNRSMAREDADVPQEHARRGSVAWARLQRDLNAAYENCAKQSSYRAKTLSLRRDNSRKEESNSAQKTTSFAGRALL